MNKEERPVYYMPQLDALRAFAVLLVIISHWFSEKHFLNRYTQNGSMGVTLFFVLSGFLITGILLRSKEQVELGNSTSRAYKIFYARRSLRIFPVYFLLLFILLAFNIASIKESFSWHFFYASNIYFWLQGHFSGSLSHFWSLAVEEQFYLLWPAVIFFAPTKQLLYLFAFGIAGAVFFRYVMITPQNDMGRILMPGSLDSFCIGGCVAFGRFFENKLYKKYLTIRNWMLLLSFVILFAVHFPFFRNNNTAAYASLYFLIISFVFGIWIDRVADGVRIGPLTNVLNNRAVLYVGKISYGIYLFHNFIPYFYGLQLPQIFLSVSPYIIQGLRFLVLIGLSSLSWFLLEKPFLSLKKRFELRKDPVSKLST